MNHRNRIQNLINPSTSTFGDRLANYWNSTSDATAAAPSGFVYLSAVLASAVPQQEIYRIAFEAAQRSIHEKRLAQLRQRAPWN